MHMDISREATQATESFMERLIARNPGQPEFHQAVREVTESLMPFILERPEYQTAAGRSGTRRAMCAGRRPWRRGRQTRRYCAPK